MNNKKKKNIAVGLSLLVLAIIFYVVTIIKM